MPPAAARVRRVMQPGGAADVRWWGCGLLLLAVLGCGPADQDEDLGAMSACGRAVEERAPEQEQRATVRDDGPDAWVVNVWTDGPAEGVPDHTCDVVRDEDAGEGFRVVDVRP